MTCEQAMKNVYIDPDKFTNAEISATARHVSGCPKCSAAYKKALDKAIRKLDPLTVLVNLVESEKIADRVFSDPECQP